jgi:adenosine deaminase
VSTDDPLCFANTVGEEYESLAAEAGFTTAELAQLARNGWEVAEVPAEVRRNRIAEIDRLLRSRENPPGSFQ